ncbi:MAG: HlyD family efflux transporter periplasmic adaptor subunit, partial [Eubacteriales bacterium]|nr:HlyD family efflux transporter periplasmic adaptor subunit [Eubacteriales bacterium]
MPNNKNSTKMPRILARIRKIVGLNIGTVMFGVLFLYMVFSAVLYLTSGHIESYQVTSGPLSRNETYTGLAIREETVNKADSGGYVTYYAREGSKVNATGAVYGLSASKTAEATVELTSEQMMKIRNDMLSFSKGFSPSKFNNTYSFKYELEGNILQYAQSADDLSAAPLTSDEIVENENSNAVSMVSNAITLGNQTISKAQSDGIILYSKDNYEGKTVANVTAEDFDQNSYHETDLKTNRPVKAGDDIYTIITDERWSLLIPLSEKQAVKLNDRTSIRVKFLKDGMTQSGDFSIIEIDGGKYGKIDFNKGLIRYASDRFLDIELVTNTVSG